MPLSLPLHREQADPSHMGTSGAKIAALAAVACLWQAVLSNVLTSVRDLPVHSHYYY